MRPINYDPRATRDVRKYRSLYVSQAHVNIAVLTYIIAGVCAWWLK